MIKRYYQSHKDLTLFLISIFLILVGWGVSVVSFDFYNKSEDSTSSPESAPISLVIRLLYGIVATILPNYYLDGEYQKGLGGIGGFLSRYRYYISFSVVTIVSGWFLTIRTLLERGYIPSVIFRLSYGVLCTFVTLRFIPKGNPTS